MVTRNEALDKGLKRFDGLVCKNCGNTEKFVSSRGCIQCSYERNAKYYKDEATAPHMADLRRRNRAAAIARNPYLDKQSIYKRQYGLTIERWQEMLKSQDNKCAICNRDGSEFQRGLAVDHNHTTGKVRALLCVDCNTGIGKFKEDPELMKLAMEYLKEHNV